jgi:peroxiredoxin
MKFIKTILPAAFIFLSLTAAQGAIRVSDPAPDLTLKDINGKPQKLSAYKGRYVVLEWMNFGCPFVKKHYETGNMQTLQRETTGTGAIWLSICSSAKGKEGYMTPEEWKRKTAEQRSSATDVLLDQDGKVGRLYGAKATPHMFIVNPKGVLIYQGAIDDKPTTDQADVKTATNYVRQALNEAKSGQPVSVPTTEAYGCSVKY